MTLRCALLFPFCFLLACGEPNSRLRLGNLARIKVYMNDAGEEVSCDGTSTPGILISEAIDDFETEGFASVQIDHVPAHRKVFFIVTANDLQTGKLLGYGCTDVFEVAKNGFHNLHLTLSAP